MRSEITLEFQSLLTGDIITWLVHPHNYRSVEAKSIQEWPATSTMGRQKLRIQKVDTLCVNLGTKGTTNSATMDARWVHRNMKSICKIHSTCREDAWTPTVFI